MIVLIPMAGAGSRFAKEGYTIHKPAIPTTNLNTGEKVPMVVAATNDIPDIANSKLVYIDRDFHKNDKVEDEILKYYPNANFITINYLTEGQASTCLLAKHIINTAEELFIAGCDNGMIYDLDKFKQLQQECDVIVFTYRNNESVLLNPNAYGWVKVGENNNAIDVSVKKAISDNPMKDNAIVASFWFKQGN
ncbi:MAG: nucleotidyltransferase, partial [Alphaproteobacteria bacterium]|nr:nucleotidyltransferase [Alphaproteobacteria bacterium]